MDSSMLKKWKKLNAAPKSHNKGIKFLKRTLSFSKNSVPKGCVALCVGEEMKRFVIPTEYLSHKIFSVLLREAEESFGFYHEGVLRIPCDVYVFENILETVKKEKKGYYYCSMEVEFAQSYQSQEFMCR